MRYTDPDGREDFFNFCWHGLNTIDDLLGFLADNTDNTPDKATLWFMSALGGNENSRNKLNCLSDKIIADIQKKVDGIVVGGMEFVAKNGSKFAMFAYASGNVGVGIFIDGMVVVCDVSLAYREAVVSGDYKEFRKTVFADITSMAISSGFSSKFTNSCLKNFPLSNSDMKTMVDAVSNILTEPIGDVVNQPAKDLWECIENKIITGEDKQ